MPARPQPARPPAPYLPAGWRRLDPVVRGLIAARALRSVAQGALAADFVLYLRALHWGASAIGLLLAAGGMAGGLLGLLVGPWSDRHGRRTFLLAYQAALFGCTLAILGDPHGWVLVGSTVLFGFGLGANGAAGPFAPAEQAWLARHVPAPERGAVFSLNAAVAFWGMGAGSLLGGLVPLWAPLLLAAHEPGAQAYLPLFLLTLLVAALNFWQIRRLREAPSEEPDRPAPTDDPAPPVGAPTERRQENRALALLAGVNAVNSLGIGLFGPLLPYWFAVRYGVGPGSIGSVYAITFLLTGVACLAAGELAARVGLIRSIVGLRLLGVGLLLAMPLMPSFAAAAALYAVRSIINRGSAGARQAFGVGLVRDARRGWASSLNNVSWSLPSALGPALGGWLMAIGSLDLPFYLASALQLAYALLFGTVLRPYEPGRAPRPNLARP